MGLFWLTAQENTVHHSSEARQQEGEGGVTSRLQSGSREE